jgi:hypothetical protein
MNQRAITRGQKISALENKTKEIAINAVKAIALEQSKRAEHIWREGIKQRQNAELWTKAGWTSRAEKFLAKADRLEAQALEMAMNVVEGANECNKLKGLKSLKL